MNKFLSICAKILVVTLLAGLAMAGLSRVRAEEVILEDGSMLAGFDSESGALIRLENKSTRWVMEQRSELGRSFRMHLQQPGRSDNYIQSGKQHTAVVGKNSDRQLRLQWKDVVSDHGVLPITLTATVTLKDGALTFNATVDNHSSFTVESVEYPYLGDLNPPAPGEHMDVKRWWRADLPSDPIHMGFDEAKSHQNKTSATLVIQSADTLFCLVQAAKEGLCVVLADPTQPYQLEYVFEQLPGLMPPASNPVLPSGALARQEFRTSHHIYAHPGSAVQLSPVVLQFYQGDWHAGVDLYKKWRATWYRPKNLPAWVKGINSWLQLQINTPEEDYRVAYTNLVQYGDECASNGVAAIQLVGWNHGGQDGGNPSLDTDPGLGTWQELHAAIDRIQAKGVKMILFGKPNYADITTAWVTNELYRYACTDPDGKNYLYGGFSYFTPTQLAGLNNHRWLVMDFNCPAYEDIAVREFKKILALDAAGWLWDQVGSHGPAMYSFATNHGYVAPGYTFAGDRPLAQRMRTAANEVNTNFLFSGEALRDWLGPYFPCSYFRITEDLVPVCRYLDPQAPLMVAVTGFDDREMLNLILMNRYIISYEPYNFKGHLADFPLTLAYGQKIDALRRKYQAYLWDAEFRDTLGASVTAEGDCKYAVFVTAAGKRAVVVANMEFNRALAVKVALPNPGGLVMATPEAPEAVPTTGALEIPARSAAVIMEQ